jgi:drug/metabolite transporter (DMT)-like permease
MRKGLKKHDSYIISALIYSSPIFTLLLACLFLNEQITYYGLLGVLFIVVGVGFISTNDYKIEDALRD